MKGIARKVLRAISLLLLALLCAAGGVVVVKVEGISIIDKVSITLILISFAFFLFLRGVCTISRKEK